jgi:hypothetical protein
MRKFISILNLILAAAAICLTLLVLVSTHTPQVVLTLVICIVWAGGFKFVVRQIGRGWRPDISVSTQAPSSYGVRVCIETEMSSSL